MKFKDLTKDLLKLRTDLRECRDNVTAVCLKSSGQNLHPFQEKMEAFLSEAKTELESQEKQLRDTHKMFLEHCDFYLVEAKSGEKEV